MKDHESFCNTTFEAAPRSFAQRFRHWWKSRDGGEQYLAAATDLADLEHRMRVLERSGGGPAIVTFNH
jgi:Protein of unknown function (DUF3563)